MRIQFGIVGVVLLAVGLYNLMRRQRQPGANQLWQSGDIKALPSLC